MRTSPGRGREAPFFVFPEGYVATPKSETACCLPFQNKCSPSQSVPQNSILCTLIYKLNKGSLLVGCTQVRPYVNSNKGTKYPQLLLLSTINPVPLCRLTFGVYIPRNDSVWCGFLCTYGKLSKEVYSFGATSQVSARIEKRSRNRPHTLVMPTLGGICAAVCSFP